MSKPMSKPISKPRSKPMPNANSNPMPGLDRRQFVLAAGAGSLALHLSSPSAVAEVPRGRGELILSWQEVRPGVWVSPENLPGGNVMIVASRGGVGGGRAVVVDSKFPFVSGAMAHDALVHAGIEGGEAGGRLTLVNTHHHGDHTSGNATFSAAGATIVAHVNAAPRIASQIERYRSSATSAVDMARQIDQDNLELLAEAKAQVPLGETITAADVVPVVAVGDSSQLNIGEAHANMTHFVPAHTDNDLIVHFTDLDVLHTGDLVFHKLHPFFDPEGGASARGWITSLQEVLKLCTPDTVVVPGHGAVGDRSAVKDQLDYLEALVDAVAAAQKAGKTKKETAAQSFDFMEGLGFETIRSRAIMAVWDELAAE